MTAQVHEVLIVEGEMTSMAFCPDLPVDHPRVVAIDPRTLGDDLSILSSTACWRGYQGTWEIKGGRFCLVRLDGRYRLEGTEPLLADWFTGVLRIPRGKMLQYVHMGFGSVFEEELHIRIEKGVVVGQKIRDNRGRAYDPHELAMLHLPGGENQFPGDEDGTCEPSAFEVAPRPAVRVAPRPPTEQRVGGEATKREGKLLIQASPIGSALDWNPPGEGEEVDLVWEDGTRSRAAVELRTGATLCPPEATVHLLLRLTPGDVARCRSLQSLIVERDGNRVIIEVGWGYN